MPGAVGTATVELRMGRRDSFDISRLVDRLVWTESMIAGGFSWSMQFKTDQWSEWSDLLLGREQPKMWLRLRSVEDGNEVSTEWRRAITDWSRVAFSQNLTMPGHISGADKRLDLSQVPRTRAWRNTLVSDVIEAIALEAGLLTDLEATSSREADRLQVRTTDWAYMRSAALRASAEGGRGDIYLWLDEDTIRLRTPPVSDLSDRRYDVSVVENRVEKYVGQYNGRLVDRGGGGTLQAVGFDFERKEGVIFTMDGAAASAQPSLAGRVPRDPGDALRILPVPDDDQSNVEEWARAHWGKYAPRYFSVRLETRPDLTVGVNRIAELQSNVGEVQDTPYMGRYVILEVQHVYEAGSIRTTISLFRREAQEGEEFPTGSNAENVGTRDRSQFGTEQRTIITATEIPTT